MGWSQVWKHQLRWARTIRVCQPLPYFFSILSNPTLWPLLWLLAFPTRFALGVSCGFWFIRCLTAANLQRRLVRAHVRLGLILFPLLKDLLQAAIWVLAFAGNRIEWRGERMKLKRDGTLVRN
jgi:ceramide glucosyltransferase